MHSSASDRWPQGYRRSAEVGIAAGSVAGSVAAAVVVHKGVVAAVDAAAAVAVVEVDAEGVTEGVAEGVDVVCSALRRCGHGGEWETGRGGSCCCVWPWSLVRVGENCASRGSSGK